MALGIAGRAVVAGGNEHDPSISTRLDDEGLAEAVAQVVRYRSRCGGIGKFPEHLARGARFIDNVGIGYIQRVVPSTPVAQATHENRMPVGRSGSGATDVAEIDIPRHWRAVHIESMLIAF